MDLQRVPYNRETHSGHKFIDIFFFFFGLGQRLIDVYRETFRDTHSDILINIQYIQSELEKNILLMQFSGRICNATDLYRKVFSAPTSLSISLLFTDIQCYLRPLLYKVDQLEVCVR